MFGCFIAEKISKLAMKIEGHGDYSSCPFFFLKCSLVKDCAEIAFT
jgi:hypothetical protein